MLCVVVDGLLDHIFRATTDNPTRGSRVRSLDLTHTSRGLLLLIAPSFCLPLAHVPYTHAYTDCASLQQLTTCFPQLRALKISFDTFEYFQSMRLFYCLSFFFFALRLCLRLSVSQSFTFVFVCLFICRPRRHSAPGRAIQAQLAHARHQCGQTGQQRHTHTRTNQDTH